MMTKVLIIDDSDTDRFLYRHYLEKNAHSYEVHEAADGEAGLRLVDTLNPDCILLDLNLLEQSGYEVLGRLVGLERPPKRSVIILTGLGQDILMDGALSLGATDFLLKGQADAAALDAAIQKALAPATHRSPSA